MVRACEIAQIPEHAPWFRGPHVGPHVIKHIHIQSEKCAVFLGRHTYISDPVHRAGTGHQTLHPVLCPFDGNTRLFGSQANKDHIGVAGYLDAKGGAHVRRHNDAQFVCRRIEGKGHHGVHVVRTMKITVRGDLLRIRVIIGYHAICLVGVGCILGKKQTLLDHHIGLGKCPVHLTIGVNPIHN